MSSIKPQTLKGFRDFLPPDMVIRKKVIQTFSDGFERYGYEPLETPVLEYADILLGKYGKEAEQLLYRFTDRGGRSVAMKYDLTVPACRVIAQYADTIPLPFKRYQIQPVWRADNTQKGRFREFYQCDADTFGSSSMIADAEFIQMGIEILQQLGFAHFKARINNRKFIDGLTLYAGANPNEFYTICIAMDKWEKIGKKGVTEEMEKKGVSEKVVEKIIEIVSMKDSAENLISVLLRKMQGIQSAEQGLQELKTIFSFLNASGTPSSFFQFDLSIIRGLAYYTGPVWEFSVSEGNVGSVGGCGRYDKLVHMYLGRDIPATGGSFGIERIIEIVKERNMLNQDKTPLGLVTIFAPEYTFHSIQLACALRKKNKTVLLYPDEQTKLDKQLKFANKKNIETVYILGPEEIAQKKVKVKNMKTGEQKITELSLC